MGAGEEWESWRERRRGKRYRVNLRARWEGRRAAREATVTDISEYGCFVLDDDLVEKRETVKLELELARGVVITLWGTVVYQAEEIGFALNFERFANEEDRRRLQWLLRAESHRGEKQ
jgi:hypothetical protein